MQEEEFEEMWKYLATNLPNSFRFTGTKSDALAVRETFKQRYIPRITAVKFEGKDMEDLGGPGGQAPRPEAPAGPEAVTRNW